VFVKPEIVDRQTVFQSTMRDKKKLVGSGVPALPSGS